MHHRAHQRIVAIASLVVLSLGSLALAGLYPQLMAAENGNFRYSFVFTTNGDELLTTGSSITIYDVAPVGSTATFSLLAPSDTLTMSLIGITPQELSGINDDPDRLNLTYTFRGRLAINYDSVPNQLFIEVPGASEGSLRTFYALTTFSGNPLYTVGQVQIPNIVPEPTATLLAACFLSGLRRPRR